MDDKSGPDELALYCLSHKYGLHTSIVNKSYIWTTLSDHFTRTDEEILNLCGVNLVYLGPTTYGILRDRLGVPIPNHITVFSLLRYFGLEIDIKTG